MQESVLFFYFLFLIFFRFLFIFNFLFNFFVYFLFVFPCCNSKKELTALILFQKFVIPPRRVHANKLKASVMLWAAEQITMIRAQHEFILNKETNSLSYKFSAPTCYGWVLEAKVEFPSPDNNNHCMTAHPVMKKKKKEGLVGDI